MSDIRQQRIEAAQRAVLGVWPTVIGDAVAEEAGHDAAAACDAVLLEDAPVAKRCGRCDAYVIDEEGDGSWGGHFPNEGDEPTETWLLISRGWLVT